jgi:hypothetical protein
MTLKQLDRQYFWVDRLEVIIKELRPHFDEVTDVSYVNDQTPSVEIDNKYILFLPNSIRTNSDTEEYNYYLIVESDGYGTDANTIECESLEKAIDELKELLNN